MNKMNKISKLAFLAGLIPAAAMASDKPEEPKGHPDYITMNMTLTAVDHTVNIQDLGNKPGKLGLGFMRRIPYFDTNKGVALSLEAHEGFVKGDIAFSIDEILKNLELQFGAGYALFNGDSQGTLDLRAIYHLGPVDITAKFGTLVGEEGGLYTGINLGIRHDFLSNKKK